MTEDRLGLYVHIPFCIHRCDYCDFATVAGEDDRIGGYLEALHQEISSRARSLPRDERVADTVFLGGGTPSYLPAAGIAGILERLRACFDIARDAEITIEANPESTSVEKAFAWMKAGVNRVSLGVQSLDEEELKLLVRSHDADTVRRAVAAVRGSGVGNVSLDLLGGIPAQTPDSLGRSLDGALALTPEHVSVYLLETDKPTPLARRILRGDLTLPGEEETVRLYDLVRQRLGGAGYVHYEISNWSRAGFQSRHNRKYWTGAPFLGFGLSAHSFVHGVRCENPTTFEGYEAAVAERGDPSEPVGSQTFKARAEEAVFTGLRLLEGIGTDAFQERYGAEWMALLHRRLETFLEEGLLETADPIPGREAEGRRLRLTPRGLVVSNEIFAAVIG